MNHYSGHLLKGKPPKCNKLQETQVAKSKRKKVLHKSKAIKMKLVGAEVTDLKALLALH